MTSEYINVYIGKKTKNEWPLMARSEFSFINPQAEANHCHSKLADGSRSYFVLPYPTFSFTITQSPFTL